MNMSDLKLFIRIAETSSITESAKQLGLTPAAVSYSLKRLEEQLGVELFIRTTRRIKITPQGTDFLFYCRQSIDYLERGLRSVKNSSGDINGELRMSVMSDLGRNIVLPWIDEMMNLHPGLSINFHVTDSVSDFFTEDIDVGLRYGKPDDSSMVAFHIATFNRVTCASPSYISNFGNPSEPSDLIEHNCLIFKRNNRKFNLWEYSGAQGELQVKVAGDRISNDTDIVRRWAIMGKGIIFRTIIDVAHDLENGNLVKVLDEYETPEVELYLVCPNRKQVTPAIIYLRDLLRRKCKQLIS